MSGVVLIQNLQRMCDDNEKLREEVNQKTEAVELLQKKIKELNERNEK